MRKLGMLIATAVALYGAQAAAAPITGQLSLSGTDSFTSTSIDFTGLADIDTSTGSFASVLGTCDNCVTMNDFTSTSTNFVVYTDLGNDVSLTLSSVVFDFESGSPFDTLEITGTGTATLTGFDPTPGSFSLTTQGTSGETSTGEFTFSATTIATPVPEPASLAIFGSALVGFAWVARRRRNV